MQLTQLQIDLVDSFNELRDEGLCSDSAIVTIGYKIHTDNSLVILELLDILYLLTKDGF